MGALPPRARKQSPQASALRLCSPPLRFALSTYRCAHVARLGDPPLLAVATPRVRHVAFGM